MYRKHSNNRGNVCYSILKRLSAKFSRYMNIETYKDGSSKKRRKEQIDKKTEDDKQRIMKKQKEETVVKELNYVET